jgi:hypothetical protein
MNEYTNFQKQYFENLKKEEIEELAKNDHLIQNFKWLCSKKGLDLTSKDFKYIQTIGIVACYPNILETLCPNLIRDKEGLIDFNLATEKYIKKRFIEGYLYADNFILMVHPYFRRGYFENNHFPPRFIETYWNKDHSNLESSIALDFNRVRINIDGSSYMERNTWFGPNFDRNIGDINDGTVQLRPPANIDDILISFFFQDVYSLDIKWESKEGIKMFQSEEFKTEKVKIKKDGIEYFPVRYIHAEYDLSQKCFRHFDGAIHFYTELEYYTRRDSDFNYNFKNKFKIKTKSEKLFKFNGKIDVDTWIEYSGHFMSGNPLVFEYFERKYPDHIIQMLERESNNKDNKTEI